MINPNSREVEICSPYLFEQVGSGRLRVQIDRTFPLAEAAAAHAYIESRQAFGRVVMTP